MSQSIVNATLRRQGIARRMHAERVKILDRAAGSQAPGVFIDVVNPDRLSAAELAREAREASRPYDVHCQTISRTVNAKVLAQQGEPEAAEELAREAIAFVAESDFLPAHAEALMDLAEILLLRRPKEAVAVLTEALRLHRLKGNVVSATKVCALLDELG